MHDYSFVLKPGIKLTRLSFTAVGQVTVAYPGGGGGGVLE